MDNFLGVCFTQALLLVFQGSLYLLIQKFEGPAHNVEGNFDRKIPLVTQWVYLYVLWYPLIAIFPVILYSYDVGAYESYLLCILIDIVISTVFYWAYPTSFERTQIMSQSLSGKVLGLVRIANYTGKNCMPSMHCSMCYIIMAFALSCEKMHPLIRGISVIISVLIVISTVFTKQHTVKDVAAAIVPAAIGLIVCAEI